MCRDGHNTHPNEDPFDELHIHNDCVVASVHLGDDDFFEIVIFYP
jgi:hypothetical protein